MVPNNFLLRMEGALLVDKGLIGCPHPPRARLARCSLDLFGYLHVVPDLAFAVQNNLRAKLARNARIERTARAWLERCKRARGTENQ